MILKPKLTNIALQCLCFFFIGILGIKSSAQNISFKSLGLEEGLSEASGLCIGQDKLKRIWVGTRNGLNCWDGVRMKTFYPERGDTTTLLEHKVSDLCLDTNYLWALSSKGLSRLDLNTMKFKRFYIQGVSCIEKCGNKILVGTRRGLLIYNAKEETFEAAAHIFNKKTEITHIYEDSKQNLWLASKWTLIKISDTKTEEIPLPIKSTVQIKDLLVDSQNRLWIATSLNGLWLYHIETNKFETITTNTSPFYLNDISVRTLAEDEQKRLWVGTFKGLSIFDFTKKTTSVIQPSTDTPYGLNHNSVYSLFLASDNNMWIGTYFGGINYGKFSNQVLRMYQQDESNKTPSYSVIGEFIEDKKGNLWIATEGGGVDYFDREKNTFTNYPSANNDSGFSQTNIKSIFLTQNNKLLVGTYQGGLNILDIATKKVKHYSTPAYKNSPLHVTKIIEYEENYLLATRTGVILFNPRDETFTPFFKSVGLPKIRAVAQALYFDSKGILWIGFVSRGLITYNPRTKNIKRYSSNEFDTTTIGDNSINDIVEDHRFRIWIGTDGGGLCLYNRKEDNFATFNKKTNNLPSDFIYGITESRFGNLWISTSKGLTRFDVENKLFFNYTRESGFPLEELNYKSLLLTESGDLFVGGIDGMLSFKEKDLLLFNKNLNVNFSSLYVNNKEVRPSDETGILEKDISVASSFTLKPNHSVFSIDFTAYNYNNTLNNKYQYQLVGFDANWVNAEFKTEATYTNLNPGKYTFKIRATDVSYKPLTNEKSIEIIVQPPFSRTWYAFTFYALFIIGLIVLFNNFYLGKIRLQYQLKNERAEKERIEELNIHKLRFFTNISHEFMTPLTIILSSLENIFAKYKIPSKQKWQLRLIMRNALRLKHLNTELLDFRKIEQGHLKIKAQENNIVPYLDDIFEAFKQIAQHKKIKYTLYKKTDSLTVFYDSEQMDKVFYNLLSNAINHVPEKNGEVSILLNNKINEVEIKVINNGPGIPKDALAKVFNRFFHQDSKYTENQYKGSGIGLALSQSIVSAHKGSITCQSEQNKETTFTVTLLKGTQHFSNDEIADSKQNNIFSIEKELIHLSEDISAREEDKQTEETNTEAPLLLIVDDNQEIRIAIKSLFAESYRVITAKDGAEGLEKTLEHQPNIIISDILMPVLSGLEMCKKLKANIKTSHIPVLLLTALDSEEDRTLAFKHGADSYCTKPFSSQMLKARVENLFCNRKILQQKFSDNPGTNTKDIALNAIDREFINRVHTIVEKNLQNMNFNMDEFAAEMKLGRTIFYSKVKSITGQTPNEYIQTIRLKKAAHMLLNDTHKNISEIAYDTGFNSPRYFAKAFKNHFGVNPSKYVKRKNE